jgi:hypothetical protein
MNWTLTLIFRHLVAPTVLSWRSTLLGLVFYGIPLALSYLHGVEQILVILGHATQDVVNAVDGTEQLNIGVLTGQLALLGGLLKAFVTKDPQQIEAAVNATAPRATVITRA